MTVTAYPQAIQKHFVACLQHDPMVFEQCRHLFRDVFDDQLVPVIRYLEADYDQYGCLPSCERIEAKTGVEIKLIDAFDQEWFLREFVNFAKYRRIENAVLGGLDLLHAGKPEQIIEQLNAACDISYEKQGEYQRLSLTELLNRPTPDQLIPDLLFERQVSMIYGESKALKSFIELHLASALAHGRVWLDHRGERSKLRKQRVVYVAAEGGAMFGLRRLAWMKHYDLPVEDDWLEVIVRPVDLMDRKAVLGFIKELRDIPGLGLIIFDTLSASIPGNSDSNDDVASLVLDHLNLIARELACHVSLVHHEGKDASRGWRGSSAFFANADTVLHAERLTDTLMTKITVTKQKDGPDGYVFSFLAHEIGLGLHDRRGKEMTSLAIEQIDPIDVKRQDAEREADVIIGDRHTIASVFSGEGEMPVSQVVDAIDQRQLLRRPDGNPLGKTIIRRRVIAALPDNTAIDTRIGEQIAQLYRPKAVNGIANMVKATFHPFSSPRGK